MFFPPPVAGNMPSTAVINGLQQPLLRRCHSRAVISFDPSIASTSSSSSSSPLFSSSFPPMNSTAESSLSRRRRHFSADEALLDYRRRQLLQARRQGRQLSDPTKNSSQQQQQQLLQQPKTASFPPLPPKCFVRSTSFKGPRTLPIVAQQVMVKAAQRSP